MDDFQKIELIKYIQENNLHILLKIIDKISVKPGIKCYTNGSKIIIGEDCFETTEELMILIIHEFLHIIGNSIKEYEYYKNNMVSLEAFNIIEDRLINNFIEIHFPGKIKDIENNIFKNTGKQLKLVTEHNWIKIFNEINPCIDKEFYKDYVERFKNNVVINKMENLEIEKIKDLCEAITINLNTTEIHKILSDSYPKTYKKIVFNTNWIIKSFDCEKQIFNLKSNCLVSFYSKNTNFIIFEKIIKDISPHFLRTMEIKKLFNILFKKELNPRESNTELKNRIKFLNNNKLENINLNTDINSIFNNKPKKLNNKNITKIQKIIIKSVNKFLINKGNQKTWKREHKTLPDRKGKIHKKRGYKNIQIFIDRSGSMNGSPWNDTLSSIFSLHRICMKQQMRDIYTFFNSSLSNEYKYNEIKNLNFGPYGCTNINNVLRKLNDSDFNIIITDFEDKVDFKLLNKNVKLLVILISDTIKYEKEISELKNIDIVQIN